MSIGRIDRGRSDADEDLIISRDRLFDFSQLKICCAVFAREDCFHRIVGSNSIATAVVGRHPVTDEEPAKEKEQNRAGTPLEYAFYFHVASAGCAVAPD